MYVLHVISTTLNAPLAMQIDILEHANLLAIHARRVTVQPRDIQLLRKVRGDTEWHIRDYTAEEDEQKKVPPLGMKFSWATKKAKKPKK